MSQSILGTEKYIFSASSKTIIFNNLDFDITKVKAIVNVTRNAMIYCPASGLGGTISNNVLTLTYDTTAHSNTDKIQILYDWEANYHKTWECSFGTVIASGVQDELQILQQGSGQNISQSAGNLIITSGTTINAETIIRSKVSFSRDWILKFLETISATSANNRFEIMLADTIGDGLAVTVASATSATVVVPNTSSYYNVFVKELTLSATGLVGRKLFIGACSNVTGAIAGQYAIASATYNASAVSIVFTVAGWTAASSGTCTLYGFNAITQNLNGATNTAKYFDTIRNGWHSNLGYTTAYTMTAASTIHGVVIQRESSSATYLEQLHNSNASITPKTDRKNAIPADETTMQLYIICRNGTATATASTWNLGIFRIEEYNYVPTTIRGIKNHDMYNGHLPVQVLSGSVAISSGTVTSVTSLTGITMANTSIPATSHRLIAAATTNATLVKSSAGNINSGFISNFSGATVYFKFFNMTTAPTVGTSTPIATIGVSNGVTQDLGIIAGVAGFRFSTGISYCITGAITDADSTAVALGVSVFINYV